MSLLPAELGIPKTPVYAVEPPRYVFPRHRDHAGNLFTPKVAFQVVQHGLVMNGDVIFLLVTSRLICRLHDLYPTIDG
jgi:hypothetical protein